MSFDEFQEAKFKNVTENFIGSVINHTYKSHTKTEEYDLVVETFTKSLAVMNLKATGLVHEDYRYDFEYKLVEINDKKLELELVRTLTPLKFFAKLVMLVPGLNDITDLEKELQFIKNKIEQSN